MVACVARPWWARAMVVARVARRYVAGWRTCDCARRATVVAHFVRRWCAGGGSNTGGEVSMGVQTDLVGVWSGLGL